MQDGSNIQFSSLVLSPKSSKTLRLKFGCSETLSHWNLAWKVLNIQYFRPVIHLLFMPLYWLSVFSYWTGKTNHNVTLISLIIIPCSPHNFFPWVIFQHLHRSCTITAMRYMQQNLKILIPITSNLQKYCKYFIAHMEGKDGGFLEKLKLGLSIKLLGCGRSKLIWIILYTTTKP